MRAKGTKRVPAGVRSLTFFLSRSPELSCSISGNCCIKRSLCVPLPTPGAPTRMIRAAFASLGSAMACRACRACRARRARRARSGRAGLDGMRGFFQRTAICYVVQKFEGLVKSHRSYRRPMAANVRGRCSTEPQGRRRAHTA